MELFIKNFYDLIIGDYSGINLTRITNYEEFKQKQIDDSLAPLEQSEIFKNDLNRTKLMVDIGFGGGFPILPMAKINTDKKFIGIETRAKKVKVVSEISSSLGLDNVSLIHDRIENILIDKECVCTLKAVGKVFDFLNKINTTKIIHIYFYKGPNFYTLEKDQLIQAKHDWKIVEEIELSVEGTEKRYLIGFENKKVLHGTNNKLNNLVKLSDLT